MDHRSLAIKKRAQQLVQKGQIDAALAEFERLFDGGDKDPYDFILVADLLAKRGSMQEAVRRYRQAMQEYGKAELYKNAIAVCKKILRISKEDLDIHRSLGELYAKEGLYGDAQIHYLEFAEGSIRRHEFEAALDVLDRVLQLSPDNEDLSEKYVEIALRSDQPERGGRELLRRAERLEHMDRMDDASQARERASTLAPGISVTASPPPAAASPPAWESAPVATPAETVLDAGFGSSAFEPSARPALDAPLEAPVEAEPPDAEHEAPALDALRRGDLEGAVEEYWKAAEAAFYRGELGNARSYLESLIQLAPEHELSLRRLVEIAAQAEDPSAEARARFDLAELYLGRQEWALSRAEYMRVLEIDPASDRARLRVARIDAMNGDISGEPIDLDSLPGSRPQASVRVRDEQPAATESLVDLEEIIDEFKAGVSHTISGEDHESHYDLGMAYMEMGLYDEAIHEFQVASKGTPIELKCLEMIALCYLEKNEPATAARELMHALELPGHGPDETISIRYNLGMAFERLGNLDRALQHFEEVYLLNVDFFKVATKVRELKQRIAAARGS